VCVTNFNPPDTKSNPNHYPNPNSTTKQHATVNIKLNIIINHMSYIYVVAPSVLL